MQKKKEGEGRKGRKVEEITSSGGRETGKRMRSLAPVRGNREKMRTLTPVRGIEGRCTILVRREFFSVPQALTQMCVCLLRCLRDSMNA